MKRKRGIRKKEAVTDEERIVTELTPLILRFTSGAVLTRDDIKEELRKIGRSSGDGAVENVLAVLSKIIPIYDYAYARYKLLTKEDLRKCTN